MLNYIDFLTKILFAASLLIITSDSTAAIDQPGTVSCSDTDQCSTPECLEAAVDIYYSLDNTTNPCHDFYQFACGGWLNTHFPFDIYPPVVSVLTEAYDDKFFKLRVLLEKDSKEEKPYEDLLKSMYKSCMKTEKIEELGLKPLKDILDSLGGWPMVKGKSWDAASFDWIETLRRLRELGYDHNILIGLQITSNKIFGLPHTIMLDHASLGIPRSSLLDMNHKERFLYYLWMFKTAQEMDTKKQNLYLETEISDVLDFEATLAKISTPNEDSADHLHEPYTVKDLLNSAKEVDWLRFFKALLNEQVTENERLFIKDKNFVTKFADLMKKTDKRVVANYMMWRVIHSSFSLLPEQWRNIAKFHSTQMFTKTPRWIECISDLSNSGLDIALNSYYFRHYFKEENKDAEVIISNVLEEILNILETENWIDKTIKDLIKDTMNVIEYHIGYPNILRDVDVISKIYKDLKLNGESYFAKTLQLRRWSTDYYFSRLRKPYEEIDWLKDRILSADEASYIPFSNSIELPAEYLRYPYFSKELLGYLNFGGLGFAFGRQIVHGLYDIAQQFGKDSGQPNKIFKTDAQQCFKEQYNNVENNIQINNEKTLLEIMADNGGLRGAYRAWLRHQEEDKTLPGLHYTKKQLFWIGAASVLCENRDPKYETSIFNTLPNPPARIRVNGLMSNIPEFAEDFQCLPDTPMNRKNKCSNW